MAGRRDEPTQPVCKWQISALFPLKSNGVSSTVIPTTSKKEVRFEGDYQDTLPRSRSYSGKSTRSSGRRRKGTRQKTRSDSQNHSPRHRKSSSRSNRHSCTSTDEPSTSTQSRVIDGQRDDDDDTETTRSNCSTCSSSSSDSDDFPYELPQRNVYGGVRVNYVPNDALACARKEQQQFRGDQSNASDRDKNCTISWGKMIKNLVNDVKKLNVDFLTNSNTMPNHNWTPHRPYKIKNCNSFQLLFAYRSFISTFHLAAYRRISRIIDNYRGLSRSEPTFLPIILYHFDVLVAF
jgi:hypothetical protein